MLAILAVALYFILPTVTQSRHAFSLMLEGSPWLLGLAVLAEVADFLSYAYLTRSVLHSLRVSLGLGLVLRINMAGFAASRAFSVGGVGGWVVTYRVLARRGVSRSLAVVAVATQQFFTYAVLWILFFVAIFYLLARGGGSVGGIVFALVCIALILGGLAYLIHLYNHPAVFRRRARQAASVANRVRRRPPLETSVVDDWVDRVRAGIRPMTAHHGALRSSVGFAVLWWGLDILCLFLAMLAFGYTVNLGSLLVAYSVAYTVATFVPTPGGLGTVEALLLALLTGFGVPASVSVVSVLTYRLINFWLPIPVGIGCYISVR